MDAAADAAEVEARVREVVARHLPGGWSAARIPLAEPLSRIGLDSLASINLLVDLEQEFRIEFPDEMLTPANFGTAAHICAAVARLCSP